MSRFAAGKTVGPRRHVTSGGGGRAGGGLSTVTTLPSHSNGGVAGWDDNYRAKVLFG
jgi:hypothetical protein